MLFFLRASYAERTMSLILGGGLSVMSLTMVYSQNIRTGDAVLVRDAWAAIVPTFHQSVAHENKSQEDWVPRDLPDLEKWAYIGPYIGSRDATRRFLLFYTPEAEHRPPRQVVMRLQGYVEAANLATLGNWNG